MNKQKLILAQKLLEAREESQKKDNSFFQNKRKQFLDFLATRNWNPSVQCTEMYSREEVIKLKPETYNYFDKNWNTRTKIHSETCFEIDVLPKEKSELIIVEVCKALLRNKIHFAVFYAEGQRSPHIRIYDFEELRELDSYNREIAQLKFWRKMVPFSIQFMDKSILSDEHYLQIEFAPHWKYGTMFDLIFEWVPENKIEYLEEKSKKTFEGSKIDWNFLWRKRCEKARENCQDVLKNAIKILENSKCNL